MRQNAPNEWIYVILDNAAYQRCKRTVLPSARQFSDFRFNSVNRQYIGIKSDCAAVGIVLTLIKKPVFHGNIGILGVYPASILHGDQIFRVGKLCILIPVVQVKFDQLILIPISITQLTKAEFLKKPGN